ncbi:GspMb/PilO family protein [Clostridium sp.]|uniref:GspMb/PilO family protein n=1 Tax=Clostridium sp. TaxID=1506 RepID=UPI002582CA04|nr:GspMb/PilO family protein [Clostridium sp.]MDF2502998.1 hypothetical protein [Clostridium sp.]
MNNLSKREKYLIVVIGVLAVIYVYYSFFLSTVINKIKAEKSMVNTYNVQLQNINEMKVSNKKLSNELDTLKEENNKNSMALPSSERDPEIVYNLKTVADANKVNISNVNMSQPTSYSQTSSNTSNSNTNNSQNNNANSSSNTTVTAKPGSLLSIPVNLSVTGEYDGIVNFISSIEKDGRLSTINSINLGSQGTGAAGGSQNSASNSITASIALNYFYIVPSANDKIEYDFNKGSYGKDNPFK